MPLVVGIDEAGYGPLLGPLVIGATLWRGSPAAVAADGWALLADGVCRSTAGGAGRLPVGDSKRLFDRKRGLATLERTVLAFVQAVGRRCGTVRELLTDLCSGTGLEDTACPWYRDLDAPLPRDPARSACGGAAARLTRAMQAAGLVCCGLRADVVPEDGFNRRVHQTRNKAALPMEAVLRLIAWAGARCGPQDLYVRVDRLGGRADYRRALLQAFPDRHVHELAVGPECSRYRLATPTSDWHVEFAVEAEQRHLPVALASMLAKYVRELLMERFNAFWGALRPGVQPTAGYYTDARRFLKDIGPVVERGGIRPEVFVRQR